MSQRVVIRLHADGTSDWLARGAAGATLFKGGLPPAGATQVDLILPAEQVLLLDAPRLAKRATQLAQALPYAIEEQLAGPVEQQHVAFDEAAGGSSIPVAVIARDTLRAALQRLDDAGLMADRCVSAAQLVPLRDGQLNVLVDGDEALLRWARSGVMSCRSGELNDSIHLLRDSGAQWQQIHVWRSQRSAPLRLSVAVIEERIDEGLGWFAQQFERGIAPDLLQGEFRPRRDGGRVSAQWRWAAGLAGLGMLLGLVTMLTERMALERHANAQRSVMEALLREAVPGTQRIVDPLAQLSAELKRRAGGQVDGALPLLGTLAPLIAGSGRYTIESLDYRNGALELTIIAPDVAALDSLRATLAAARLDVELTSALAGSNGYEGRLRIKERAS